VHALCCVILNFRFCYIFPRYLINGTIFQNKLLHRKCVFWVSLHVFEVFLILRRNDLYMINNVHWHSCKVPFILVRFLWNLNFLDIFSKNTQMPNFMKLCPVGASLFHADRRTDLTKLLFAFRHFTKAPKNAWSCKISELSFYDCKYTRDVVIVQWQVQYELIDLSSCWQIQPML
jgi:hypothetical protein